MYIKNGLFLANMNGKILSADNVLYRKIDEVADVVADNGMAEAELTTTKEPEKAGRFQESWISCPLFLRVSIKKDGGQSGNLQKIGV